MTKGIKHPLIGNLLGRPRDRCLPQGPEDSGRRTQAAVEGGGFLRHQSEAPRPYRFEDLLRGRLRSENHDRSVAVGE